MKKIDTKKAVNLNIKEALPRLPKTVCEEDEATDIPILLPLPFCSKTSVVTSNAVIVCNVIINVNMYFTAL